HCRLTISHCQMTICGVGRGLGATFKAVSLIHNGKLCCLPSWSRVRLNRRNRPAGGLPTSFRV
ncbi:MAG: hypothetical protein LBL62_12625, partial [Planctomycetaceae bacterium]|nr:hypothetical protein [Planctomycetaceae bacterium]